MSGCKFYFEQRLALPTHSTALCFICLVWNFIYIFHFSVLWLRLISFGLSGRSVWNQHLRAIQTQPSPLIAFKHLSLYNRSISGSLWYPRCNMHLWFRFWNPRVEKFTSVADKTPAARTAAVVNPGIISSFHHCLFLLLLLAPQSDARSRLAFRSEVHPSFPIPSNPT